MLVDERAKRSNVYIWWLNLKHSTTIISDSGVKSSSQNEDEPPISPTSTSSDDVKKKRSILRKMSNISGVSLRSSPSTPLFDFPTFDELFETEGKQHMKLSMHQSKSGFLRQQSYPGPAVSVLGLELFKHFGGGLVPRDSKIYWS